jgi:hypothetical protein
MPCGLSTVEVACHSTVAVPHSPTPSQSASLHPPRPLPTCSHMSTSSWPHRSGGCQVWTSAQEELTRLQYMDRRPSAARRDSTWGRGGGHRAGQLDPGFEASHVVPEITSWAMEEPIFAGCWGVCSIGKLQLSIQLATGATIAVNAWCVPRQPSGPCCLLTSSFNWCDRVTSCSLRRSLLLPELCLCRVLGGRALAPSSTAICMKAKRGSQTHGFSGVDMTLLPSIV